MLCVLRRVKIRQKGGVALPDGLPINTGKPRMSLKLAQGANSLVTRGKQFGDEIPGVVADFFDVIESRPLKVKFVILDVEKDFLNG